MKTDCSDEIHIRHVELYYGFIIAIVYDTEADPERKVKLLQTYPDDFSVEHIRALDIGKLFEE